MGWYLTLPLVPLSILAGVGAAGGGTAAPERPRTSRTLRAACASAGLIALLVAFTGARYAREARRFPKPDETFDADRRLAGLFLREHAAPGETLKTAYGWTAFESRLPVTDTTGLNTTPFSETATYAVYHGLPYHEGSNGPGAPPGMVPLASFNLASSRFPGFSWFVLFGRPDSAIARSRLLALRLRLSELRHHARDDRSAEGAIDGIALAAPVPSITSFEYADGHIRGIFLTPWSPDDSSVTLSIEADAQELWHWRDSAPDKLRRVYVPVPRNSSANVVSFKAAGKGSAHRAVSRRRGHRRRRSTRHARPWRILARWMAASRSATKRFRSEMIARKPGASTPRYTRTTRSCARSQRQCGPGPDRCTPPQPPINPATSYPILPPRQDCASEVGQLDRPCESRACQMAGRPTILQRQQRREGRREFHRGIEQRGVCDVVRGFFVVHPRERGAQGCVIGAGAAGSSNRCSVRESPSTVDGNSSRCRSRAAA